MDDMTDQARKSNQDDGVTLLTVEERRQHNDTAPINSLPNELLAHIFSVGVLCEARGLYWDSEPKETTYTPRPLEVASDLPAGPEPPEGVGKLRDWGAIPQTQDPSPSYLGIQVVASHVCSRWRECSLATPTLWTHIALSHGAPYTKAGEWLKRSKGAPLEVVLDFTRLEHPSFSSLLRSEGPWGREYLFKALEIVIPHVNRWKVLEFRGESPSLIELLLQELLGKEMSTLERLALNGVETPMISTAENQTSRPARVFPSTEVAPRLRSWSLRGVHIDWNASCLGGTNITSLELAYQIDVHRPTILLFSAMLESCPNLEELALTDSGPSTIPTWAVVHGERPGGAPFVVDTTAIKVLPILLPRLEELSLSSFDKAHHVKNIIELIQAPGLLKLTLSDLRPNFPRGQDYTDTIWTITSSNICQNTLWEEVKHAPLSPRYPRLEELSVTRVSCASLLAYSCMFYTLRSIKRLLLVTDDFAPHSPGTILSCFIEPSSTGESFSWLEEKFGTPCPLLDEFQCSGVNADTLLAFARRRDEIGKRLRKMGYYAEDRLSNTKLMELHTLVDELVERENPDDWRAEDFEGDYMDDYDDYGNSTDDSAGWSGYDEYGGGDDFDEFGEDD